MTVVTRFAPSPTGYLHIGGARTALFNWLFARHHGGRFLLRIEDTDRARSTEDAIRAILDGLRWLGTEWDGEPVYQFARAARHAEVAKHMVASGQAYYCYTSAEELETLRAKAQAEGKPYRHESKWRDGGATDIPADIKPVIRLKAPREGETVIRDLVQGEVTVHNSQLDDMVLLRSDGTPTYMLAVVVDDHDMGVTHIIRGDDHLTNAARQMQIYLAMGWNVPAFAHIPLIHGADGAKLSKRHGAVGLEAYRDMGFLPEAMRNYLLRLGWSHGDEEIIITEQAVKWFNLEAVGKSPARFDMAKLENLNGHYIREADDTRLVEQITPLLADKLGRPLSTTARERVKAAMAELKLRAHTLMQLADFAWFLVTERPLILQEKAAETLGKEGALPMLRTVSERLANLQEWAPTALEALIKQLAEEQGVKLGQVLPPLRAALTGTMGSLSLYEALGVLGREESLGRINDALEGKALKAA